MSSQHELIEMPNSLLQDDNRFNTQNYHWLKSRTKSYKIIAAIIFVTSFMTVVAVCYALIHGHISRRDFMDQIKVNVNTQNCGQDWVTYGDEKCFTILNQTFASFDEAVESCGQLAANLPIIHTKEEQNFLSEYLFKISGKMESFWIGAKFGANDSKFHWIDNSELTYTNWVEKGPKSRVNYCVAMQGEEDSLGKWIDEQCEEKNYVVCQKTQFWSHERLQKMFISTRKDFGDSIQVSNRKIDQQQLELDNLKQNVIPIGFIYAQLPNEKSPSEIWPWMTWTDVSSTYAGVFFRVAGDDAAPFRQIQQDNAPRLAEIYTGDSNHLKSGKMKNKNNQISIPKTGWSDGIHTGSSSTSGTVIYTHFRHSTGEVRPRNMAIRVWKRIS